jgi:glycosyltransferase involved in cell wall biosynthesis
MPLRVAIVAPWGERLGGAEEMLWLALRHCDRGRLEPALIFLGSGPFVEEVSGLGIVAEVVPAGRLRHPRTTLAAVRGLAAALRRLQPDLLLCWSAKTHIYGAPAARIAGMGNRVIWWQHQIPGRHWVDRLATLLPARAVGCSSDACRQAQESLRPRRRPTFVVNPGIDLEAVRKGAAGGLRERLGIPPGRAVAGIVGRLQPWKGQDRFLTALAQLRQRGLDVHGLLVGGGAYGRSPRYVAELERLIPRLGLSDFVTLTGQVDDPAPYFELMDVAVNASQGEPFGIVLLEAMAAGVPMVAVGEGGPLDIVEPGVTGTLVTDGRPETLAAAIGDLLADPRQRAAMSAASERRCRERFGAQAMADRLTANLAEFGHA